MDMENFNPDDFIKNMTSAIKEAQKLRYIMVNVIGNKVRKFVPENKSNKAIPVSSAVPNIMGVAGDFVESFGIYKRPRKKVIRSLDVVSIEEYEVDDVKGSVIELENRPPIVVSESIYQICIDGGIKFEGEI